MTKVLPYFRELAGQAPESERLEASAQFTVCRSQGQIRPGKAGVTLTVGLISLKPWRSFTGSHRV